MPHYSVSGIRQLGYLGIGTVAPDEWRKFGCKFLGMQSVDIGADHVALRMDERAVRIFVIRSHADAIMFLGFEMDNAAALALAIHALRGAGLEVHAGSSADVGIRSVDDMAWFLDPDGNRIELYHGPRHSTEPFVSGRPIGGFRTGELGLGHVVLSTARYEALKSFYIEVLGFRLSDYMEREGPFSACFMHVNPRHHSLALIAGDGPGCHHIMVEYQHLDDIGRLYDIALQREGSIVTTLGRHSNDHMVSFYARTPSTFLAELGWAGRLVDDLTWQPHELRSPSLWGHDRAWLSPAQRLLVREELAVLAAQGAREPVEVAVESPGFSIPSTRRI